LLSLLNDSSGTSSSSGQTIPGTAGDDTLTGGSGKDTIDHAPGGHDDLVNSVAGVAFDLVTKARAVAILPPIICSAATVVSKKHSRRTRRS
jgi:hypothetical protein